MPSPATKSSTKGLLNIPDVSPRFGSTKLAAAAVCRALTLVALSALVLIAARPAQAQTETVLYNFTGGSDGGWPTGRLTFDSAGNLYGTTELGGTFGAGTVFELSPNGSGGWNEIVLHSFTGGPDGGFPLESYVIFDSQGNLYGAAGGGGAYGYGVVFELSLVGTSWTETVLYSFTGGADGARPVSGLIMDPAGNLYGTTWINSPSPVVFELSPSGGGWTEQVIYAPVGSSSGLTMDAAGNIFGIGWDFSVFELSPNGNGGWTGTTIYSFPSTQLFAYGTLVLDRAGNLYGTTEGQNKKGGTVYELSPAAGNWTEKILHSFAKGKYGVTPSGGIVFDAAGNIYGTTIYGGKYSGGTVFELVAPVGTGDYTEKLLWSFNGTDGAIALANLILDSAGNLYGTTYRGGSSGEGVVFEVSGVRAVTTATLTSSPNPSTYGQAVTFTAVVTSNIGAPPDGETVSFMKGKTVLGTGTLSGGTATFTTSALKVGTTKVTAVYGADSKFDGSKSNQVKQVVEKAGE